MFVNFNDGNFCNLIRLIKPYKNGLSYALYDSKGINSKLFKNFDNAKKGFDLMVHGDIRNQGVCENNF
jgi:hypothetical protein